MQSTIGPNPVYAKESQEEPSGFGLYSNEGRTFKLFKGESLSFPYSGEEEPLVLYVASGQIACSFRLHGGSHRTLFMRGHGRAFLNENTAEVRKLGSVCYTARRNAVLVGFTRSQVRNLVQRDESLFDELLALEHRAFVQIAYRAALTDIPSASERILQWLRDLGRGHPVQPNGSAVVPCNLTLEALSDYLNIHITTLTRLLASLKTQGLLERTRTHLVVKDFDAIERLLQTEDVMLY